MQRREIRTITGDELRDPEFDRSSLLGECVTITITDAVREQRIFYTGHVERFEGDDYECIVLDGIGAIHHVLLEAISELEV